MQHIKFLEPVGPHAAGSSALADYDTSHALVNGGKALLIGYEDELPAGHAIPTFGTAPALVEPEVPAEPDQPAEGTPEVEEAPEVEEKAEDLVEDDKVDETAADETTKEDKPARGRRTK
ncbi:hypothetical protein [Spirosoma sp. 209]|uniref:hypothetical protein n=1 Tax=Spirosoma sp. 209 TaxID=1955701 RepID=UPI00098D6D81|nr:hypothetical protein [Spirosoma sp. 209]